MKIMNFRNWIEHIDESIKDDELNRILDKISDKKPLTNLEQKFLNTFDKYSEEHYQDLMYLTKNDVFFKLKDLLENENKIVCDLYDSNGKIGELIKSIYNNYEDGQCYMKLKNGEKVKLKDNFLYNVIYNITKDEYSLQSQDEYYEKIPVKDEN